MTGVDKELTRVDPKGNRMVQSRLERKGNGKEQTRREVEWKSGAVRR